MEGGADILEVEVVGTVQFVCWGNNSWANNLLPSSSDSGNLKADRQREGGNILEKKRRLKNRRKEMGWENGEKERRRGSNSWIEEPFSVLFLFCME